MNAVKAWSAAICMAALAAALLRNLTPNGPMERMIRFVIGAFVICVMLPPIAGALPQLSAGLQESAVTAPDTRLQNTVSSQLSDAAEQSIRNLVVAELERVNIKCENVSVIMDTRENGSISINRVVVKLAKGYGASCNFAAGHLEKVLGLKMEVTADGGKG